MPNRAYVLKVDGTTEELDHRPTLEEAQKIVGGWVEFVHGTLDGKAVTIILDEEGKLKDRGKNSKATLMYWAKYPGVGDIIVGDVVVLERWKTLASDHQYLKRPHL